jgi:radical SAM protein with 4Fe4S-binding SPASM domain
MINLFIKDCLQNGKRYFFNTLTKEKIEYTSDLDKLSKKLFLKGQERECVESALFSEPKKTNFEIIPTWECNLRCGHCSVLHQLVKKSPNKINCDLIIKFIKSYSLAYEKTSLHVNFVGGEPLMEAERCCDLIDGLKELKIHYGMTTNGIRDCDDKYVDYLLRNMHSLTISIDGTKETHNNQRKAFNEIFDPYEKTVDNIKKLIEKGFRDKLTIQASLRDKDYNEENRSKFYEKFLRIGILKNNLLFGCIHPTEISSNAQQSYLKMLKSAKILSKPCCKFRYMGNFLIDNTDFIYSSFFKADESTKLGRLDSDIKEIQEKYKTQILESMPCLKDKNCLNCPVLAYCWGNCIAGQSFFGNSPSNYCSQNELIEKINNNFNKENFI